MPLRRRRSLGAGGIPTTGTVAAAALAAALLSLGVAPATATPEPPLVVPGGDASGDVRVEPSTQQVMGDRVAWQVHNGGAGTLSFELAIHEVEASAEGATVGDRIEALDLATDRLTLAAGELARVPLHLPDDSPRALALVATTVDAEPETTVSGLALVGGGGAVTPDIVATDAAAGTFTLRLDAVGPTLVDVAVRATAWPGRPTTTHRIDGVLVPAGGRDVPVRLTGPVAGRVELEVAVAAGDEVGRASRAVWWWPRSAVVVVAVALLLVTVGLLALVRRRRG